MNEMPSIALRDSSGQMQTLRYLFASPSFSIIAFHDSVEVLPRFSEIGVFTNTSCVVLTSSWYRGEMGCKRLREALELAERSSSSGFTSRQNVLVVANSDEELVNIRVSGIDARIVRSNNCCFLNEDIFPLSQEEKSYDAVLNSKPLRFKRHELSALVENKVFITYDASEGGDAGYKFVDIEAFSPAAIFKNIDSLKVAKIVGESRVGLILSELEGACYASAEYLLSGLPVVSTVSKGGRDDFYDYKTAVVVPSTAEGVAQGVAEAKQRLQQGAFQPEEIRQRTITRFSEFRQSFGAVLSEVAARHGVSLDGNDLLISAIRRGSKLSADRNFWITDVM